MSPVPTQQRFAMRELMFENQRRSEGGGSLGEHRVAFYLERLVGPPVEGHALVAKSGHRLGCECGRWGLWVWSSLRRGTIDGDLAVRHDEHRQKAHHD